MQSLHNYICVHILKTERTSQNIRPGIVSLWWPLTHLLSQCLQSHLPGRFHQVCDMLWQPRAFLINFSTYDLVAPFGYQRFCVSKGFLTNQTLVRFGDWFGDLAVKIIFHRTPSIPAFSSPKSPSTWSVRKRAGMWNSVQMWADETLKHPLAFSTVRGPQRISKHVTPTPRANHKDINVLTLGDMWYVYVFCFLQKLRRAHGMCFGWSMVGLSTRRITPLKALTAVCIPEIWSLLPSGRSSFYDKTPQRSAHIPSYLAHW